MRRYDRHTTEIRAHTGETFLLELSARTTAGYAWQVLRMPKVAELKTERTRRAGPASGAASVQEFEFHVTRVGEGTLVMSYGRHWESRASEQIDVRVVVER